MQQVVEGPSLARGDARVSAEPEQLPLFELGGISLEALRMERAAVAGRKRSVATRRAYRFDLVDFRGWCAGAGRCSLPATPDTVGLYLVHLAQVGRLPATIARRASAIAGEHLAAGHASPVTADVRELLAGLRRKLGAEPKHAKAAVSVEDLRAMLAAVQPDLVGVRDRAIILLGFASGLRRSELAALQLSDVTVQREGLVVHVARSKTDQEGAGRVLGVHRGKRAAGVANGAPELAIMARTGHKSLGMLGRYVRHGSVFAVDPLAGVL